MKETVVNQKYGIVVYEENDWTGARSVTFSNYLLVNVDKQTYTFNDGEESHIVKIVGSAFTGVKLVVDNVEEIEMTKPTLWYEYIFAVLPFAFVMIWQFMPLDIYFTFPIVGGAIGGAISGGLGFASLAIMKKTNNPLFKVLIGLAFFILVAVICYIVAYAMLSMM